MSASRARRLSVPGWLVVAITAIAFVPAPANAAPRIAFGAYVEHSHDDPGLIDELGRQVGRRPVIVLSYKDWRSIPFDADELDSIWDRGAVPMITWEPWTPSGGGIPLRQIGAGRYDRYLRRSAGSAANWGKPFFVRFAHEMNGNWYPWGNGVNGNTPPDFRRAWHRVVAIFRFNGASNVKWVWSPNEDSGGKFPLKPLYPGDETVDWVGLDGFNFGGDNGWPSFTRVFANTYDRLTKLTSRPLAIAETGSGEEWGEKAAWIASALGREAPRFPHLRALVWFDAAVAGDAGVPNTDFRIDSSRGSLRAFRRAIDSPAYGASRRELLATPASLPGSRPAPGEPDGNYGAPSFWETVRHELEGKEASFGAGLAVALVIVALVAIRVRKRR